MNILNELENFIDKIETDSPTENPNHTKRIRRFTSDTTLRLNPMPNDDDLDDIFQAIMNGNLPLVKSIISKNRKEINHKNNDNNYPIHIASKYGNLAICELLVNSGADMNQKGYSQLTPLHLAADFNFPDVLKFFLDKGANVEVKSGWGDTPLHKAAEQDNVECVQLLLSSGANPNSKNLKNETPLEITKNAQIQRLLLQFGAKK